MDSTDLGAQVRTNLIVSDMDFELPMRCTEGDTRTKLMKVLSFTFIFQSQSVSFPCWMHQQFNIVRTLQTLRRQSSIDVEEYNLQALLRQLICGATSFSAWHLLASDSNRTKDSSSVNHMQYFLRACKTLPSTANWNMYTTGQVNYNTQGNLTARQRCVNDSIKQKLN